MRSIVCWGLSIAFHGLIVALAVTKIVGAVPSEPPPGRAPWEAEGSELRDIELFIGPPPSGRVPRPAGVDRSSGSAQVKGESLDFVSDRPFRGKGVYDSVGSGSGGSGRYGALFKRDDHGSGTPSPVGTFARLEPVLAGLGWLARHHSDGGWTRTKSCACPDEGSDRLEAATAALAVLAFLEAGFRPGIDARIGEIDAERVVRDGLTGLLLKRDAPEDQALSTLAFVHAYRLTRAPALVAPASEAIASLLTLPSGPNPPARTTFWRSLAVRCARETDLRFPRDAQPAAAPLAWPEGDPHAWLSDALSRRLAGVDRDRILLRQCRLAADCRVGSWDPPEGMSRAYATALSLLTLLQR